MRLILVFLAVAFLAATAASAEPPRGAPVDAKYVPAPFVAALVFEPARLDKAAVAAGLPVGEAWKALEGITGADTKQFERVVFLIDPQTFFSQLQKASAQQVDICAALSI